MASPATPVVNAAAAAVGNPTFDSLRLGRSAQSVVGRLIRFWDSRNISKNGEFMGITILLLDELLQVLANTSLELPDVVGEIRSVQGSDLRNQTATSRLKPYPYCFHNRNVTVFMSLWDEAASAFRGLLKAGDKSQSVMLVTTVNPKLFGGNLYLNSTQGTRFFFDTSISEIAEFVSSIGSTPPEDYTCVDTLEGVKKKELVSIGDLNTFISNSNEQTQEADFLCKAQIVGVIQKNGWFFVSCTGCHKKLEKRGTSLDCSRCATSDVTGVVRFRVELAVDDGKDSATFVSNGGEEYLPSCLEELAGKEFVFQIRVTPFNFTPNHRTFTVATISEDIEAHSENSGVDTGLEASSSGPSVLGVKMSEERASGNHPGNADAQQKRKRGRE
ncbi:hypothetical protein HID58_088567 [Brassica napus]|uniref:Replication factor A C-terminal domain-containing protein n=1 Tax=Brassica napus TaxID=3708 RepID=A0ABQ7XZ29_BRANA|nr:hypothetical protein HID58_088567 [Brassica napus]